MLRSMLVAVTFALGCADADPPAMRTLVTVIATSEGQAVTDATDRLMPYGRGALVVLEAALHTAPPPGRRHLIHALRRLGDEDAVALLAHFARYDEDRQVAAEAKSTLEAWAADTSAPSRAAAARALRRPESR
jgi:hypothetical protein